MLFHVHLPPNGRSWVFSGHSILPLLIPGGPAHPDLLPSTRRHLSALGDSAKYAAGWRQAAFIEYYYVADNDKCMQNCTYPTIPWPHGGDYSCTDLVNNRVCWGGKTCTTNCKTLPVALYVPLPLGLRHCRSLRSSGYPTESIENNFIVLRSMTGSEFGNTLYAEFATGDASQCRFCRAAAAPNPRLQWAFQ